MKILIDNGHGIETPGKRSPDGRFREYAYNRLIASAIVSHLQYRGYDAQLLVPEQEDISLKERVCRVNTLCCEVGKNNVLLVSIHVNAGGGRGAETYCYEQRGAGGRLAACIQNQLVKSLAPFDAGFKDRGIKAHPSFCVLRNTTMPAVLVVVGNYVFSKLFVFRRKKEKEEEEKKAE